jgi:signal transduction histidine kinase
MNLFSPEGIWVLFIYLTAVEAGPNAIRQIFSYLIINALKFSAASDPVVIGVKGDVINDYIHYQVSDNGIGFSNDYKD